MSCWAKGMENTAERDQGGPSNKGLIVLCSHSVHDPLVSTLILDQMIRAQHSPFQRAVLFVTEEPVFRDDHAATIKRLAQHGLLWSPVLYDHHKPFQWWHKGANAVRILYRSARFRKQHPECAVLGFLAIAGAYALLVKMLLGLRTGITLCFEPHSLYMREVGVWPAKGIKFRFASWMEKQQVRKMDVLVVPTSAGLQQTLRLGRRGPTELLGVTIDVKSATFTMEARTKHRKELAWGEDPVFMYVGKFGGIYHTVDQYLAFAQGVLTVLPQARFAVITHLEWKEKLEAHPMMRAIAERFTVMPPVAPQNLPALLSAGDLGVVAIPPTPSQVYRTPVKTAHYWAAGLPIVIPKGVSDDGQLALEHGTGIVVEDLPQAADKHFADQVRDFLAMDADARRQACIDCAMRYRDTSLTVDLLNRILP